MTVKELEARVHDHPQSPLFARLAEEYLRSRRVHDAFRLCEEGLRLFPEYTTAHLVAAGCFAQRSEFQYALHHIDVAIDRLPENRVLAKLRDGWLEKYRRAQGEKGLSKTQEPRTTPLDELAGKLKTVERITPKSDTRSPSSVIPGDERILEDAPIVSVTLAEIYATQGAYEAAIAMYRKLQRQKPQRAEQFEGKIRELEEKLRQRT